MASVNSRRAEALQVWRQNVQRWYPKLQERAYFVPPVFMKRINYETQTIGADTVAVAQPPVKATAKASRDISVSDVREDQAQQHILHCLHELFQQNSQVVFVLSQLNFAAYLREACFVAAAREFPRATDLRARNLNRGDFDFLFIHRQYGLVAFEVKSIGTKFSSDVADEASDDKSLVKRLQQATKQMNKSRDVLKHLTGDLPQPPKVTTSLMLPYITAAQLRRVLTDNPHERQALCDCLGVPHHQDPAPLCLTSDRLSDKTRLWHMTDDVMQSLTEWWHMLMEERGEDTSMTDQVYEDLIARFAGPATTVQVFCPSALTRATRVVRTEGEAVSETAERYMDMVLSPHQIHILNSREKLVYLTGPPGTGKTVVLLLKARQWLSEGHDVHVVSMLRESIAVAYYLYKALNQKHYTQQGGRVYLHHLQEKHKDVQTALPHICSSDSDVYLIADEVDARLFKTLYNDLRGKTRGLHMWTARIFTNLMPSDFTVFTLTVSLRSPACVTRQVQESIHDQFQDQIGVYENNPYPHTDGPSPRELRHQGPGHDDDVKPDDCQTCGLQLAAVLRELHVGESDAATSREDSPRTLQYRDVFVLKTTDFRDSSKDQTGETVPASGLVRGLRQAGVPVRVFTKYVSDYNDSDLKSFEEVATMTGPDAVLAVNIRCVSGLERKLVVWVQTETAGTLPESLGRMFGLSRSAAQLIIVSWPGNVSVAQTEGPNKLDRSGHGEGAMAPADSAVHSPQLLPVSDDRKIIEEIFHIMENNVTEQDVRDVNAVVQVTVTFSDGADVEALYFNLTNDGDRIIRGVWPGEELQIACRIHLTSGCFQRALIEGQKALADILKHTCCFAEVYLFGETLKMLSFFQRVQPLLRRAVLRLKGEAEQVDQLSLD